MYFYVAVKTLIKWLKTTRSGKDCCATVDHQSIAIPYMNIETNDQIIDFFVKIISRDSILCRRDFNTSLTSITVKDGCFLVLKVNLQKYVNVRFTGKVKPVN